MRRWRAHQRQKKRVCDILTFATMDVPFAVVLRRYAVCVRVCVCAGVDAWQWCNVKHGTDILRFTGITASTFFSTSISLNARDATDRASVCTDFSFNVCSPPLRTVFRIRHFLFFLLSYKRFFFFLLRFSVQVVVLWPESETTNIVGAASSGIYIGSGCMCVRIWILYFFVYFFLFYSGACDWIKSIHHELMAPQVVSCETKRKERFCFSAKDDDDEAVLRSHGTTHSTDTMYGVGLGCHHGTNTARVIQLEKSAQVTIRPLTSCFPRKSDARLAIERLPNEMGMDGVRWGGSVDWREKQIWFHFEV